MSLESKKGYSNENPAPANAGEAEAEQENPVSTEAKEGANAPEKEPPGGFNQRLLEESKRFKQRAIQAEKELEKLKLAKQQEQGQYREMYETLRKQYDSLEGKLIKDAVKASVREKAKLAGCVDSDALLKLGKADLIEYDMNSGEVHGADLFVEEAKRTYPYLFSAGKTPTINPMAPGGPVKEKKLTASEIARLPQDQKMKIWAELMK